ncbi:hypothetical protein K432DRAFT_294645 [Lepidopterella palustris CBS 459.81]|uniref:Uncharacterized protein n=1 Tax=Lepidopterella palustris CBS 459.81 TaxID=1314670 RepID=A0A8E2ED86_9PEZI|nr:hypothetical protein K432DRAFT_294645 [Lepidopterella palustris CBS 459.81]
MVHQHHHHNHLHHAQREAEPASSLLSPREPVEPVLETSATRTLMERTRALLPRATSCTAENSQLCQKPESSNTLPIVLAAVIPIVLALLVLVFLHRRHTKKLKIEDLNDKHKSLDFGLETTGRPSRKGKGIPEMTITDADKSLRQGKGLSMDIGSPYILPPGLQGSRESFHSMSRSMHDPDDPYRPVTFIKDDAASGRGSSLRNFRNDNSSTYTASSGGTERMNGSLLRNAQRMSQSLPPRADSMPSSQEGMPPVPQIQMPAPTANPGNQGPRGLPSNPKDSSPPSPPRAPASKTPSPPSIKSLPANPRPPPRVHSQEALVHNPNTTSFMSDSSDYGDGFKVTPPSPHGSRGSSLQAGATGRRSVDAPMTIEEEPYAPVGLGVEDLAYDPRRLSMSVRPLPPEDPTDNPEQRANRIRSFYKEYFDDSKPEPVGHFPQNDYYEDYGTEYLADGAVFDPMTGNFVVAAAPYAEPVTRRAMTPPPRAPPRFQGSAGGRGHFSSGSTGRFMPPPRGQSSMSGYMGPPRSQSSMSGPRKPMPPPAPLTSLPTPHKLKEDSMVFNPIDFAPPVSYRDRQAGRRPDSPLGVQRPYSPAVRSHTPLASAFDELNVMPSPHALRKSGTFTGLDFAPPPRFRNGDSGSDSGSIRSNRSGMSALQLNSIRAGAYRVSRIPKGVVGTKDDLMVSLRPKLDLVSPA